MALSDSQLAFFEALRVEEAEAPPGVRGRFEVYHYAYFERIRASIEEDFPLLFAYLEEVAEATRGVDSAAVTRDLLARNHPFSWTLAEASRFIAPSLEALLPAGPKLREALRLAGLDEAEALSAWLLDYEEPSGVRIEWVGRFASGELKLARTKTWRVSDGRVFWRSNSNHRPGVQSERSGRFATGSGLIEYLSTPRSFEEFSDFIATSADGVPPAEQISKFLQDGIAEGWLRFVV